MARYRIFGHEDSLTEEAKQPDCKTLFSQAILMVVVEYTLPISVHALGQRGRAKIETAREALLA